jgi:HSP20 family protein
MRRASVIRNPHTAGIAAGAILAAVILTAGAAWAGKDNGKVEVKTGSSAQPAPAAKQAPAAQKGPDYMDPVREMIQMQRDMNRFLGRSFAAFSVMPQGGEVWDGQFAPPNMDLSEKADAYHVTMDLPGMDKSGISVEVKDNVLTVKAERKQEFTKKDGGKVLMQERSSGFMSRALMLAKPVNASKVTADYKDGVLKITLPKEHADQAPQKVEVK